MVAFLPMMGLAQAVAILVGQRLGANRPDLAERSTYTGLRWIFGYMVIVASVYLLFPRALVGLFEGNRDSAAVRGDRRARPFAPGLRGHLLPGRRGQLDVLLRAAGRRRHPVRLAADVRPGLADHGDPDVPRRPVGRQYLLGVGVRDGVHHRHGRVLHPAVPQRPVEDHARDRGGRWRRKRPRCCRRKARPGTSLARFISTCIFQPNPARDMLEAEPFSLAVIEPDAWSRAEAGRTSDWSTAARGDR